MKFCQDHWELLREAIEQRGLAHLISKDGATAAKRTLDELERAAGPPAGEGSRTVANFDPLMGAHWSIFSNVIQTLSGSGMNPLYLLASPSADLDESHTSRSSLDGECGYCPLCEINLLHEESCRDPRCKLDKERGYDWMIERAADDEADAWKRLQAGEAA